MAMPSECRYTASASPSHGWLTQQPELHFHSCNCQCNSKRRSAQECEHYVHGNGAVLVPPAVQALRIGLARTRRRYGAVDSYCTTKPAGSSAGVQVACDHHQQTQVCTSGSCMVSPKRGSRARPYGGRAGRHGSGARRGSHWTSAHAIRIHRGSGSPAVAQGSRGS